MLPLNVTIKSGSAGQKKFLVEMDAIKFEKLAASLGFFSLEFIKSLARAEQDYKKGRVKRIHSLKELRKQS